MTFVTESRDGTLKPLVRQLEECLVSGNVAGASAVMVRIHDDWQNMDARSQLAVSRLEPVYLTLVNQQLKNG